MKVLVCGSRDYEYSTFIDDALYRLFVQCTLRKDSLHVIEGGAAGADKLAGEIADRLKIGHLCVPADWDTHGRSAGPIRNQKMLDLRPDLVLAFICKPLDQSRGTKDMVTRAKKAGVKVMIHHCYLETFNVQA